MNTFIETYINNKIATGSSPEKLRAIIPRLQSILRGINDSTPEDALKDLFDELEEQSSKFLSATNKFGINLIHALSTYINIYDIEGGYTFKIIGGVESRFDNSKLITEKTLVDVASFTKLFTFLLTRELVRYGFFKLDDRIIDLDPSFKYLEDYTIRDILLLAGVIKTDTKSNMRTASSKRKALIYLRKTFLESNDRTKNLYTDLGSIILGKVIETVYARKMGQLLSYDRIMRKFVFEPYGLIYTKYNPNLKRDSIMGNGNTLGLVHDPKTRILGGVSGAAGIYTNGEDMLNLENFLYSNQDPFYIDILKDLGTIIYPNGQYSQKGYLGIYQKHPGDLAETYVPSEYADGSFACQGWTGSVAVFDYINGFLNSILLGVVGKPDEQEDKERFKNNKPIGFTEYFRKYQQQISDATILMDGVKQHFDQGEEHIGFSKKIILK